MTGREIDSMKTVCGQGQCAGCKACVDICPKSAVSVVDSVEHMDAVIDESLCVGCGLCHRVCQVNHPAALLQTVESWQGWATREIRDGSSSGGFASATMRMFVEGNGTVVSCRLHAGRFGFALAGSIGDLDGFAGSKYVKSDPAGIYRAVCDELEAGRRVLFVGLPCQVSALRNYVALEGGGLAKELYAIDLICHGTPSAKLLRQVLFEYGYDLDNVKRIWFRNNTAFDLCVDAERLVPDGCTDVYTMAFLNGICYTRSCYSCHYATGERAGDLTLGDSWGTEFKDEEQDGVSLALVQTKKGRELLDLSDLKLRPVDYANAVENNQQLGHPVVATPERDKFFSSYEKRGSVKRAVAAIWPKWTFKQWVKRALMNAGVNVRPRGGVLPNVFHRPGAQ